MSERSSGPFVFSPSLSSVQGFNLIENDRSSTKM